MATYWVMASIKNKIEKNKAPKPPEDESFSENNSSWVTLFSMQ